VLLSLQQVYGTRKIRGCSIIDAPPFFETAGREEPAEPRNRDTMDERTVPDAEEGYPSIFWDDNKGPVVMVWVGMFPGERESAKKIITEEHDWIICRVKPSRGASGERAGADRQSQETTFLEQHGI
jgi:hypothetical protein